MKKSINHDPSVNKTIEMFYDEHGNKTVVQTIQIDGLQGDPMPDVFGDLQQHIEETINKQKEILNNINIGNSKTTYTVKTFESDDKPLRCSNCGASINNESEVCDYCGTKF